MCALVRGQVSEEQSADWHASERIEVCRRNFRLLEPKQSRPNFKLLQSRERWSIIGSSSGASPRCCKCQRSVSATRRSLGRTSSRSCPFADSRSMVAPSAHKQASGLPHQRCQQDEFFPVRVDFVGLAVSLWWICSTVPNPYCSQGLASAPVSKAQFLTYLTVAPRYGNLSRDSLGPPFGPAIYTTQEDALWQICTSLLFHICPGGFGTDPRGYRRDQLAEQIKPCFALGLQQRGMSDTSQCEYRGRQSDCSRGTECCLDCSTTITPPPSSPKLSLAGKPMRQRPDKYLEQACFQGKGEW